MYAAFRSLALALPVTCALAANANSVDITMVSNGNGGVDVKLRATEHFQDIVSTLVFTIRWDVSTDAHLGAVSQNTSAGVYLPIIKSDTELDAAGYRYQIFSGLGFTPMHAVSAEWVAGQEYTVATIPIEGTAVFNVVDDAWTLENNGSYYVALGGINSTGSIYELSTGIAATDGLDVGVDLQPNPADKECTVVIDAQEARPVDMELFDAAGQVVWAKRMALSAGRNTQVLDLSSFSKGVYTLRLRSTERTTTHRLVKR